MLRHFVNVLLRFMSIGAVLVVDGAAQAVTTTITRSVETNQTNRPFFSEAALPTFANEQGYVGTATPGVNNTSTVTNADAGTGGDLVASNPSNNGIPLGVGVSFSASFTVQTVDPTHLLTDGGNPGLGVDSTAS